MVLPRPLMDILQRPYFEAIDDLKAKHPDADLLGQHQSDVAAHLGLESLRARRRLLTAPIWLYQLWAFIVPGLLAKEKKWALIFIGVATPMFIGGVVVGYVVLPKAITVLLSFTQSGVTNLQDINAYLSFLLRLMLVFGIAFLIPLIVSADQQHCGSSQGQDAGQIPHLVIFGTFVFGAVASLDRSVLHARPCRANDPAVPRGRGHRAHPGPPQGRRAALAGDDLLIRGSVEKDKTLRELSKGSDDIEFDPQGESPDQVGGQPSRREGPCSGAAPQVSGTLRDGARTWKSC